MTEKTIPIFGFMQPTIGSEANLGFCLMKGQPKRPKFVALRTRKILAANVIARMEARYKDNGDKFKALAEDAGTSLSTIQRVTQPDRYSVGVTVDVLTQVAMALRCEPAELLQDPQAA